MPLELWFLNVGHGDCTIIRFPSGRMAMVDINNAPALDEETEKEISFSVLGVSELDYMVAKLLHKSIDGLAKYESLLTNPVDFWKTNFNGESIFRFVVTHPDMDHLSGLYRLMSQERVPVLNLWDTRNSKMMQEQDFENSPHDYRDWQQYQVMRESASDPKVLRLRRKDEAQYWVDDGVTILSPTAELETMANTDEEWNHLSYVLRIQYGKSAVVLTGDPSLDALKDLYQKVPDAELKAGLFSAPHHGRDTGYYGPLVKAMSPKFTIVSVGKKPENDASNKYRQYSEHVYSTRFHGTMHAKCWQDGDIWLFDHAGNRLGV